MKEVKYYQEDGLAVVAYLKANGFEKAELIGSLAKVGFSNNDIDIYVTKSGTAEDRNKIINLFSPCGWISEEDWGLIRFTDTKFGNVDIFFSVDGLD